MERILVYERDGVTLSVRGESRGRLAAYAVRLGCERTSDAICVGYRFPAGGALALWNHGLGGDGAEVEPGLAPVALDADGGVRAPPVFFESVYYVTVRFAAGLHVRTARVRHDLAEVVRAFDYDEDRLMGTLTFVNTPGRFRLCVEYATADGGARALEASFLVVSVKMDVQRDYRLITARIERDRAHLVYSFLARTLGGAGRDRRGRSGVSARYQVFRRVFDSYTTACRRILHQPHLRYVERVDHRPADRIRNWTPRLANRYGELPDDRKARARLRTEHVEPEIDTVENRFVLHTLRALGRMLAQVADGLSDKASEPFRELLERQRRELAALAGHPFFRSVGRFAGFRQQSLVLQKRSGYARVYAIWSILRRALDPSRQEFEIGFKPISALYEYWCYLEMCDLLKETGLFNPPTDCVDGELRDLLDNDDGASGDGALTRITTTFAEAAGGRTVELSYQKAYGERADADGNLVYLNPQRPDIVLSVTEADGAKFTYLFDAKYRVERAGDRDASPRDAIDAMHRYRDAILYRAQRGGPSALKREIVGAYVLYPGRGGPCARDYSKAITAENIGAFPLLPGAGGAEELRAFLAEILSRRGVAAHLARAIAPRETELRLAPEKDVLVVWAARIERKGDFMKRPDGSLVYFLPLVEGGTLPGDVGHVVVVERESFPGMHRRAVYRVVERRVERSGGRIGIAYRLTREAEIDEGLVREEDFPHHGVVARRLLADGTA